jgi:small-conductance mechanosensitive channel
MQNLIYLIIMALAGGAGWYAGSWKGRDAIEALDKAKAVGEQAIAERDKLDRDLKQSLARLTSEFQQGQQQRDAEHAKVKDELTGALAQRDKTIAALGRARDSSRAAIRSNEARIQDAGTSAEERQRLLAENARLKQEVADKETQIAGFECSKVPVPAPLLSPLQGS